VEAVKTQTAAGWQVTNAGCEGVPATVSAA